MIFVVDASVAVKWFVEEPLHDRAFDLITPGLSRVAPDLIFAEVGNALWRKTRQGEVSPDQGRLAIAGLEGFFDRIVRSEEIAADALEISVALDHPIYDCFYLACAKHTGGRLVTDDTRLIKKAQEADMREAVIALSEFSSSEIRLLHISIEKIREVIRLTRHSRDAASNVTSKSADNTSGGTREASTEESKMMIDTPIRRGLITCVESLSREERADLLALFWLGGGTGEDWRSLRNRAAESAMLENSEHLIKGPFFDVQLERGLVIFQAEHAGGGGEKAP